MPQRTHGFQEERQQERLCSTALVASGTGEQRTGCIKKRVAPLGPPFFSSWAGEQQPEQGELAGLWQELKEGCTRHG